MSSLSTRYWIMAARRDIRVGKGVCSMFKKEGTMCEAKYGTSILAGVDYNSVSLRAFTRMAVDFAGPFIIIQGRGKQRCKSYLCLFTCFASRAVHLEMAYRLNTDSF